MAMVTFSMCMRLIDEKALRMAAHRRAIDDGLEITADEYLDGAKTTVGDCVVMLVDPGTLPGCSIHDSYAEVE